MIAITHNGRVFLLWRQLKQKLQIITKLNIMKNSETNNIQSHSINTVLSAVSFEDLKKWCHENLTKEQRKQIVNNPKIEKSKNGRTNIHLSKRVYVFDLSGDLIGEFTSIRKAGRELGLNEGTTMCAYQRKRPIYKMYYITDKPIFDLK